MSRGGIIVVLVDDDVVVVVVITIIVVVLAAVVVAVFTMPWNVTNALYELFCVILVLLGLDLVLVVLTGCWFGAAVVDNCLASLVIVLEMVG